jgi:hypothetical protein
MRSVSGNATAAAQLDEVVRLHSIVADFERIVGLRNWPNLPEPDGSLTADKCIQDSISTIRKEYLLGISSLTSGRWRTPATGELVTFPGADAGYDYAYDRQHPPRMLEQRLLAGEMSGALLCSSGMSALNVVIQGLAHLLQRPGRLVAFAGYFETLTLLRIGAFAGRWTHARSESQLIELVTESEIDVLLLEPVRYDWSLGILDWKPLCDALEELDRRPVIVVDTTLCGDCDALDQMLCGLRKTGSTVLRVRSGIKLDQHGLELANLGVIEWFIGSSSYDSSADLGAVLSACRVVLGATLTWPDACSLAPEFVLMSHCLREYSAGVFTTNRKLYDSIPRPNLLFSDVVHPPPPWPAPFVLLKLNHGSDTNYRKLTMLMQAEQNRRGLSWQMSGSFGFRTSRYETILTEEQRRPKEAPEGVLKITAGRYAGAQFVSIIELINELASFVDIDDVHRAWNKTSVRIPT